MCVSLKHNKRLWVKSNNERIAKRQQALCLVIAASITTAVATATASVIPAVKTPTATIVMSSSTVAPLSHSIVVSATSVIVTRLVVMTSIVLLHGLQGRHHGIGVVVGGSIRVL